VPIWRCAAIAPRRFGSPGGELSRLAERRSTHDVRHMTIDAGGMAAVAALVGDSARARMLDALSDGRALTAGELAFTASIGAPTASVHLARLVDGGLLKVLAQGRHRYYRLASPRVGEMIEKILLVAELDGPPRHRPRSPRDDDFALARSCYDHLAGRLGVALADALVHHDYLQLDDDAGTVTDSGGAFLTRFGIDLGAAGRKDQRVFCRPCLDRTERRPHLAGRLGALLSCRCFELGWTERTRDSRTVRITDAGRRGFRETLGIALEALTKPEKLAA
jgi:DNA-binding transcriptional ArsR family regulator